MANGNKATWKRTGDQLRRRRIELGQGDRQKFVDAHGLKYRIINDLENGNRGNYEPDTLIAAEVAYHLGPGSLRRALDGGELEFQPPPALTGTATTPTAAQADLASVRAGHLDDIDLRMLELMDKLAEPTRAELEQQIGAALARFGNDAPGAVIFPGEPFLADVWDLESYTVDEKIGAMVAFRNRAALHRLQDERDRRAG